MGANGSLAVTPGSGTTLATYDPTSGGRYQYVRDIDATAVTHGSWTLSATATTSAIAADVQRVGITMVNNGTVNVYMRFDATAPTNVVNHWYLAPGDRWEVPHQFTCVAISLIADNTGGALTYALATVA